jgi:putative protease
VENGRAVVSLRHDLEPGDRLRPESAEGKEKPAFTVSEISSPGGELLAKGEAGSLIVLPAGTPVERRERLFRVSIKAKAWRQGWAEIRNEIRHELSFQSKFPAKAKARVQEEWSAAAPTKPAAETLIIKVSTYADMLKAFQSPAHRVLLTASRSNLEMLARRKLVPAHKGRFGWSLPPLMLEREVDYFRAAVGWYQGKGFLTWELNNWGHFELLERDDRLQLIAGFRFNLRNAAALAQMHQAGCRWSVLSLEATRQELQQIGWEKTGSTPIVTVYAWPPLFTSRLSPKLSEEKVLVSPRKEIYHYSRSADHACIYADRPLNWMELRPTLSAYGFRHFLLDMSDGPRTQAANFERLLHGFQRQRAEGPYSLFNFEREPLLDRKVAKTR